MSTQAPPVSPTTPTRFARTRAVLASILVAISLLLAPVAVLTSWVRGQLIDSDQFTQTFAPLAKNPEIQEFLVAQIDEAIHESIDVDELVTSVFDGLSDLDLPPVVGRALKLLEAPAIQGTRALLHSTVETVVTSDAFAQVWRTALHESHAQAIALLQGSPDHVLQLSADGTLSLELTILIRHVRQALVDEGFALAQAIPDIDYSIALLSSTSLAQAQSFYALSVAVSAWLPWLVLGLLGLAIALARDRRRAITASGIAVAASLLLLAGLLAIGTALSANALNPALIPPGAAQALVQQLTVPLMTTALMLAGTSVIIAIIARVTRPSPRTDTPPDDANPLTPAPSPHL